MRDAARVIIPDTKDWTWVLRTQCPECGFDARSISRERIPTTLRQNAADWNSLLTGSRDIRQRPRPETWSPLEYACHVRDVCRIYDERLTLMLTRENPHYPNWDQDETAIEDRYHEQDPAQVAEQLSTAADQLAARFDRVTDDEWSRTGSRFDGAQFTVESFARYFIHDPLHHWYDVTGTPAPAK